MNKISVEIAALLQQAVEQAVSEERAACAALAAQYSPYAGLAIQYRSQHDARSINDYIEQQERYCKWADSIFVYSDNDDMLNHFALELEEFENPTGPANEREEAADCLMILYHYAHLKFGMNIAQEVQKEFPQYVRDRDYNVWQVAEIAKNVVVRLGRSIQRGQDADVTRSYIRTFFAAMCSWATASNYSLYNEVEMKFAMIKKRRWQKPDENGVIRHVKEEE